MDIIYLLKNTCIKTLKYILLTSRKYFYVFIDVFNTNVRHSSKIYLLKNKINAFINSGTVQLIIKA